jgi:hypothetical protein
VTAVVESVGTDVKLRVMPGGSGNTVTGATMVTPHDGNVHGQFRVKSIVADEERQPLLTVRLTTAGAPGRVQLRFATEIEHVGVTIRLEVLHSTHGIVAAPTHVAAVMPYQVAESVN